MSGKLAEYEKRLHGGHCSGELHIADDGDGPCATVYLMDVEYDPIRITFGGDGEVTIHTDDYKWIMLTPGQLDFLSAMAPVGAHMTRECYDDDGEPIIRGAE